MPPDLRARIENKSAKIGVLGLGYVGLPLSIEFARKGFSVTGFEVRRDLVHRLNRGFSHVTDVPSSVVREVVRSGRFRATGRFDEIRGLDAIIICVPTPLRKSKEPDVSYILSAVREIAPRLRKGQIIILESTTYPGTTRELVLPLLRRKGLAPGRGFFLAFSPERVDPGNKTFRIANTPKVVGGITRECGRMAGLLYSQVVQRVVPVSSAEAAEMVKLLENTFRAVNIGLANEVALMCHRLGLDSWEIIAASATKPFGYMPFYPGPGIGGHCIPLDPHYLAWKMRTLHYKTRMIELAGEINTEMPAFWVGKVADALNDVGKPMRGARILVLGVAYKKDIDDLRESPALDILDLLSKKGAQARYHDPYVPEIVDDGHTPDGAVGRSVPLDDEALRGADAVIIVTDHSAIDYDRVKRLAPIVIDSRNALARAAARRPEPAVAAR